MVIAPIDLASVASGTGGFVINGQSAGDASGRSVASAGDINGDGFDDLIIGAHSADPAGKSSAGKSYVVFGKATGFGASIDLASLASGTGGFVINGQNAGDYSGRSVASAGDINGDGFDDLIIGAYRASPAGGFLTGRSYVVFGKDTAFGASIDLSAIASGTGGFVINGKGEFDGSSYSVASAGDVNGDGFDDLIVGGFGLSSNSTGKSYVLFGKSTGFGASIDLPTIAAGTGGFVITGQSVGDDSGISVASAGDVNDDGFDDVIVGAYRATPAGRAFAGKSYVVFGKAAGFGANVALSSVAAGSGGFVIEGQSAFDFSSRSVASAGDVNGDGFADLIIGAYDADPAAGFSAGESYIVFGTGTGFAASVDLAAIATGVGGFVINGQTEGDGSGTSVASAGDVNGDGFDDVIIGAPAADPAAEDRAGKSYVLFGKATGFGASIDLSAIEGGTGGFVINGQSAGDVSGHSVASAGDIDGDGFDDLIVGAYHADPAGGDNAGKSYVVFGRDFTGAVTQASTTASEILTGSAAADDFVGGLGDDFLDGKGGADVMIGGGGDDTLKVADLTFQRLDGGSGTDTMALDGAGITLDLTAIANTKIQDIEVIDLTGTGDNSLILSALEVLNLSTTSNTLTVDGSAGDTLSFDDPGWSLTAESGGYATYVNGQATVRVSSAVFIRRPGISLSNIATGIGGFVINGEKGGDYSGRSVASAGDVNGDGFDDLIVGAYRARTATGDQAAGKSYVVFGGTTGFGASIELSSIAAGTGGFVINGENTGDNSGYSVASARDVNGDGVNDLIIGADRADFWDESHPFGEADAGKGYVVFGRTTGFDASIELSTIEAGNGGFGLDGTEAGNRTGYSVASAGDVNGDGFDDVIVGAPGARSRFIDLDPIDGFLKRIKGVGESYVVFGKATGFGASINLATIDLSTGGLSIVGHVQSGAYSGVSVASAGDFNGDGFDDLIIGAVRASPKSSEYSSHFAGVSYLVFGGHFVLPRTISLNGFPDNRGFAINGQSRSDYSGRSVSSAGDVNGDGFGDLIIGAVLGDPRGARDADAGRSYVVFGKAAGFESDIELANIAAGNGGFVINGAGAGDYSGISVASAGDVNGDGFDDLIIGAHHADPLDAENAGNSYVVFGKATGFGASIELDDIQRSVGGFVIRGQNAGDNSGRSVASAGDVNGDGFGDLIIGAYRADISGENSVGKSYVVFGENFTGTVTGQGTTASETLTGSAAADDIVAGLGDDLLDGKGGADVLIGGGGDDTLKVADLTFQRLDGGSGTDTMALDGAGITLDLTAIANTKIQDIEVIDLTGSGDNTLILSALEVLHLSTTSNSVTVNGNAGDTLNFGPEAWTRGATGSGYTTYTLGQAAVRAATAITIACFAAGTLIRTNLGDVPVEDLRPGHLVPVGPDGRMEPVKWIGHRRVDCRHHPRPASVWPVRIAAHAFGPSTPSRDLFLSPDHAVYVRDVLIPVKYLINDTTIKQLPVDAVTYYHIELPRHELVLAEGLTVESYLDTGDRSSFANQTGAVTLRPEFGARRWEMEGCAPLMIHGRELDAARAWLASRAEAAQGHSLTGSIGRAVNARTARHRTGVRSYGNPPSLGSIVVRS